MAVGELHPSLLHHVVNTLGWTSLRPFQVDAVEPVLAGRDVLLLAPTAGGKTEAAAFPLLSRMASEGWLGLSVLYICPLRALLNNLEPRLDGYARWVGRRAALWHGDVSDSQRQRILREPPDILLSTPESVEAMLVSTRVKPRELFSSLHAVVVDELHAFAGDDRGWHLLAVLERLQHVAGRHIQRVGLSATVGNPERLLRWLQGADEGRTAATVLGSDGRNPAHERADVTLDHVGSLPNAATVIAALHRGEKRLVFCESRRTVEQLALALRERGVQTFASHSSLSRDERRRAEASFAAARDCVIVATSTLELGIDVGDLDRVVQVDAPHSVSALLQRMGRSGRRAGTSRNLLVLSTDKDALLQSAGLLRLLARGYVEDVCPPPRPRHITAQQILALCLQEGRIGDASWREWWGDRSVLDADADRILDFLVSAGYLQRDEGMLFVGAEAERRFGRRHFLELLSAFTASPEFVVLNGSRELGSIDPVVLSVRGDGPLRIVLAAQAWAVTHVDWARHHCYVEPTEGRATMRWMGSSAPLSFELCRAQRDVLAGADPDVTLSRRARVALADLRAERSDAAATDGTVVTKDADVWWWTWAGGRANAALAANLPGVAEPGQRIDNYRVRLRPNVQPGDLSAAVRTAASGQLLRPAVTADATAGLKFSAALPPDLAADTLALRQTDEPSARIVLAEPRRWLHLDPH